MVGKLNSKGFSAIEAILIFILISIIFGVGYYVFVSQKAATNSLNSAEKSHSNTVKETNNVSTSNKDSKTYNGWEKYTSSQEGISFRYPKTWSFEAYPCANSENNIKAECAQARSPISNNSLEIRFIFNSNAEVENSNFKTYIVKTS